MNDLRKLTTLAIDPQCRSTDVDNYRGATRPDAILALLNEIDELRADAERFNFLCDCDNWQALDILSEQLGQRDGLIKLTDELIAEMAKP